MNKRILYTSDMHIEFDHFNEYPGADFIEHWKKLVKTSKIDIIVLAGDIGLINHSKASTIQFLERANEIGIPVVFVAGNHEFYHGHGPKDMNILENVSENLNNINFLTAEKGIVEIEGVKFLGDTLWFSKPSLANIQRFRLNDFYEIENFEPWVYIRNDQARNSLRVNMPDADVIVTHHAPSYKSVYRKYASMKDMNEFYVSDLENYIVETCNAQFWFHGHMHNTQNYILGKTRILSNPRGYLGIELNPQFTYDAVVEVEIP